MVSGCSGILNDRVYSVTPNNSSYTLDSTLLNGTTLTNASGCPSISSFIYSTCTIINDPPTIIMVGTDTHGIAVARLFQASSSGQCQLYEKWYSITGMTQPMSVIPAPCDSPTSPIPCFAVLGVSSTIHQYIIQYPASISFNGGSNPITVGGLDDTTIHPVLALPPNDISRLYVLGYPTKHQILVLQNGNNNNQTNGPTNSTIPSLFTAAAAATNIPSMTTTLIQPSSKNNGILLGRAEPPTSGTGSYINLDASIENTGPAVTVGANIVIVSSSSLSVQVISDSSSSSSSNTLPITKFDLPPPSSLAQNANAIKGIDSLTPLPARNGDLSTIWINYDDGNGNHVKASSQQPGLFISPPSTGTAPGSESTDGSSVSAASSSSLSGGAIAGIVIGSVAGFLLLVFLCLYRWRNQLRRQHKQRIQRRQQQQQQQHMDGINTKDISLTDQRFLTTEKTVSTPTTCVSTTNKEEDGFVPSPLGDHINHHHDDDNDDDDDTLPPLTTLTRQVNTHPSAQTHNDYQPTRINGNLILEPYIYHLHNEPPAYAHFPQGYATRTATRTHINNNMQQPPTECTIHYFPVSAATYVRHLLHTNAGLQQDDKALSAAGLHTYDAITLTQPTSHGQYQYIWITAPYHQHHTLNALLFHHHDDSYTAVVDCTQFSFKAWSTLSMLRSLDTFHQNGWVHRQLNPTSFFYDQASSVTDWRLLGFYQSIWYTGLPDTPTTVVWDEWSAPECFTNGGGNGVSIASMDIWSLGCILYSVATGRRVFQHWHEYQALVKSGQLQAKLNALMDDVAVVDDTYKELLQRMLQINPGARDSLPNLISYWIQANQLKDDE